MNEECLICKAPLEYLEADVPIECVICHRTENGGPRCCKRDSYLAITEAVKFTAEKLIAEGKVYFL